MLHNLSGVYNVSIRLDLAIFERSKLLAQHIRL